MDFDLQNAIIPVTVEDIVKGTHNGGSHTISGDNINIDVVNVIVCGVLKRDTDQLDQPWYTLNDASGTIKVAHTAEQEEVADCGSARVIGNIRTNSSGAYYIQAVTINGSNDINVLSCHLLERKMAFKLHSKGLPPALKEQYGMADTALPLSGPTLKMAHGSDPKESVLDFIKTKNDGVRYSEIQQHLPNLSAEQLNNILADLEQEDGHIFDASTDDPDKIFQAV